MKKLLYIPLAGAALILALHANNAGNAKNKAEVKNQPKALSDTQLGLRQSPLTDDRDAGIKNYTFGTGAPGESKRIDRSYENAPPLIPHSIEGLTPITRDNNACIGCHDPEVAKDMGATPMPKSHFYDLRQNKQVAKGIAESRFNCTQCHVPQAQAKPLVPNRFKPDYQTPQSKQHSNLLDVINQGVK